MSIMRSTPRIVAMTVPPVVVVDGVVRHYDWGSRSVIPALLGVEPDGQPAAELWFGAHPDDPSPVPDSDLTLDRLVAADPAGALGAPAVERFGARLPFLAKVLAADAALSIQVHPDLAQARAGFAAEQSDGRPAAEHNYRDDNHKPELIYALTPFEALCGFRPAADTLRLIETLDVPELAPYAELLAGPDGIRAAFTALLGTSDDQRGQLVDAVTARAAGLAGEWAGVGRAVGLAARDFPGDIGVAVVLLLNYVRLMPGEAIFLAAGSVHSYLRGVGLEVLANSDNVLRCGLTPKRVDGPELLKITDFAPIADPRRPPRVDGPATVFDVPVPDFRLAAVDLDAGWAVVAEPGPYLVVCLDSPLRVAAAGVIVDVDPGHAAFVAARSDGFAISGTGTAYVAGLGVTLLSGR
jgi:mannose-6-phosphate isomerase